MIKTFIMLQALYSLKNTNIIIITVFTEILGCKTVFNIDKLEMFLEQQINIFE